MTIPERTARYRAEYRAQEVPRGYRGRLHFTVVNVVLLAVIVAAARALDDVTALEWSTIPLTFLLANTAEYFGHKGPMHHARWPLERLCHRHAGQHHRFYTHEAMGGEDPRDFHIVLFPPVLLFFFLGLIATPIALVLFVVSTRNTGLLFVVTASLYYLTYEWLHLAYHQPEDSRVLSLPVLRALRRHHLVHHDPGRMAKWNFNITFPILDAIMGTRFRGDASSTRGARAALEGTSAAPAVDARDGAAEADQAT